MFGGKFVGKMLWEFFWGNAIFDILKPPAFQKYKIHWVLEPLCLCLCLWPVCLCLFVSLIWSTIIFFWGHRGNLTDRTFPGSTHEGPSADMRHLFSDHKNYQIFTGTDPKTNEACKICLFVHISDHFLMQPSQKKNDIVWMIWMSFAMTVNPQAQPPRLPLWVRMRTPLFS